MCVCAHRRQVVFDEKRIGNILPRTTKIIIKYQNRHAVKEYPSTISHYQMFILYANYIPTNIISSFQVKIYLLLANIGGLIWT